MALTNPDYSGFKTLSQYANQLAYLKKQYAEGNKAWAESEAAKLRWQAVLNGFDLKILETQAVTKFGGDPSTIDWADFEKTIITPLSTAATLGNLKKAVDEGTMGEIEAHTTAQQIRLDAAYKGLDMRLLEERSEQMADVPQHRESSKDSIDEAMATYVAEAKYAAELLKNAEYWKRIDKDPDMTDGQKAWYKNQVHNASQEVRAEALKAGLNLWDIEKLYTPSVTGHAWDNSDYANAKSYIDTLYKAAGKDPSGIPVPNRSTGGSTNDFAYKLPTVHKTMYGETYSGADMVVFFAFPGYKPVEIGVATTVSITTYREKKQIRTIGRISARGITKGPRTVSGKLIFTVINEHIVETLKATVPYLSEYKDLKFDELPSFDILVSMGNEYGASATLVINGVTTVDEQKTLSVEEMFTENIFTYLARDYQPLRALQKNTKETYDPQEWYSYKFREKGSELIGKFGIDGLLVSEYAKNFAAALPALGTSDAWESLKASDVMQSYYNAMGNDEQRNNQAKAEAQAAENTANSRQIFIQVFSKTTNKPITRGKITIKFDGGAYDEVSGGSVTGSFDNFNRNEGEFDWTLATPDATDGNKYYGLYVIPDNEPPANLGFTVGYSGYKGGDGEPTYIFANFTGTLESSRFTYVKVMVDQQEDQKLYLLHKDDDSFKIDTYYESYRKDDHMPSLSELTSQNYKSLVDKSYDGMEWITCEVMKGNNMAANIPIKFAWEMIRPDFFIGGNTQFDMLDLFDSTAYKSPAILQSLEGIDIKTYYTNDYGQFSMRLKDLVYFKGNKGLQGQKLTWSYLPESIIVKVYASIENGQYIQWMVRKITDPRGT